MENVKEKDEISTEDKEEGLKEMRKQAGIAMEYLEKLDAGNEEGAFLMDWEVIYGADKYKIMEEYLKERWEPIHKVLTAYLNELEASEKSTNDEKEKDRIQKEKKEVEDFLEEKHYPSREELTPEHKRKVKLEIAVEEYGIKLLTTTMKEGPLEIKYFLDILLEKIMDKVG
ncbi:MAG: hypothetical protein GX175_05780 [Halanaerobiaceae bacterium]|nr:hypothetical protein [Halanaerobiaceae bacterium]